MCVLRICIIGSPSIALFFLPCLSNPCPVLIQPCPHLSPASIDTHTHHTYTRFFAPLPLPCLALPCPAFPYLTLLLRTYMHTCCIHACFVLDRQTDRTDQTRPDQTRQIPYILVVALRTCPHILTHTYEPSFVFRSGNGARVLTRKCLSGLASRVTPFMSDIEEARAIQHRCECLEAACVRDSKLRPDPPTAT